jgi:hypothetical protein
VSTVEGGLGIIAGSFATLRPLIRSATKHFQSLSGSRRTSTKKTSSPSDIEWVDQKPPIAYQKHQQVDSAGFTFFDENPTSTNATDSVCLATMQFGPSESRLLDDSLPSYRSRHSNELAEIPAAANPARWWSLDRWRPPSFRAGLMTEFNGGMRYMSRR